MEKSSSKQNNFTSFEQFDALSSAQDEQVSQASAQDFALYEQLEALKAGRICILATDTVYGIAAAPGFGASAQYLTGQLCALKERPNTQPFACLVPSAKVAFSCWATDVSPAAKALAEKFWPGALTLVLNASEKSERLGLAYECVQGADAESAGKAAAKNKACKKTIALRVPKDAQLLKLLEMLDAPLLCTSANIHGTPAPIRKSEIDQRFLELPGAATLPKTSGGNAASSVIDCTSVACSSAIYDSNVASNLDTFYQDATNQNYVPFIILRGGAISADELFAPINPKKDGNFM